MGEDLAAQLAGFRPGSVVAGYRLEAQAGAGGMAVVFRARDERLGRPVALKVLAPALASDPGFRRRFVAESRAAAAVDDPHIIPIYEAGEADGALFIAMRFVRGGDLRLVLDREGPLPPGRAAAFLSPTASALDAAHAAGLVHRDVKPANILVDVRLGRPDHVYLSDFGVSKGAAASVSLTGAGMFIGTPDYSAPEQIQGGLVDGRADQYALACVAYELLTGSVPFERDQGMAVLLAHLSEQPQALRSRRPDMPAAAGDVLARGLAKVPGERFGSCTEFAGALRDAFGLAPWHTRDPASAPGHPPAVTAASPPRLPGPKEQRVQADQAEEAAAALDQVTRDQVPGWPTGGAPPTLDRRHAPTAGPSGRGRPARRRTRALAFTLTVAVLAGAAVAGVLLARIPRAPGAQGSANSHRSQGAQHSPGARRSPAHSAPGSVTGTLIATLADPVRGPDVWAVAFGPGGDMLAAADLAGSTYLWDVATRSLMATLTIHDAAPQVLALNPAGTILAVGYGNGKITLWDTATRKATATLTKLPVSPTSMAFSPDGTILAVANDGIGQAILWDVATRTVIQTFTDPHAVSADSVAFSPSGATLAVGDQNGSTFLWDVATGQLTATLTNPGGPPGQASVAFSTSGALLASAGAEGQTFVWDVATGKMIATFTNPVNHMQNATLAFSPSGTILAIGEGGAYPGSTYLWDTATRKLLATLTDPGTAGVLSVAFSPDGATLAAGDNDGSTYLWHISQPPRSAS